MTNYNLEEVTSLDIQLVLTILTIGTFLISLTLTYNEKLKLENKKQLFQNKEADSLLILNRSIVVFISICFLYLNLNNINFKDNDKDLKFANLQVQASIFSLISAIIVLYVALKDTNFSAFENPTL